MQRVVLDTNVFISGILTRRGVASRVLEHWRSRRFLLLVSPGIITEIKRTLNYPRLKKRYAITDGDISQLIELLERDALLVPGKADVAGAVPGDPDDEKFLACAMKGQADFVVSGDHHLLKLGQYHDIPIISVRQFLELLEDQE